MGKLIDNGDGTHSFIGGFSNKNPEDMKQLGEKFALKESKNVKPKKKDL